MTPGESDHPSQSGASGPAAVGQPARALDAVDRRIVAELVADGRLSMRDLAGRVGVSRANVYARVDRLHGDGVIEGYSARVRPQALGLGVAAIVIVGVVQNGWRSLRAKLEASFAEVEYVALTSGEFDMLLLVRCDSIETLRDVVLERLHTTPEVRSTRTLFILDEFGRRPL